MENYVDIFMSYCHRDKEVAQELVSRLKAAGLNCFISEKDVPAGELWEPHIRRALTNARRVMLLITPRSKNSLWVAAEAGAAWVLEKELIAALMFVEPEELIDVIRKHQARCVETQEQVNSLIKELVPSPLPSSSELTGQWFDPLDGDIVYFRQVGNRVVGFYDFGTSNRKVGLYRGFLNGSEFEYRWNWLERDLNGKGRMVLSEDRRNLAGEWWYSESPKETEKIQYRRLSDDMPTWLTNKDFSDHRCFLRTGKDE